MNGVTKLAVFGRNVYRWKSEGGMRKGDFGIRPFDTTHGPEEGQLPPSLKLRRDKQGNKMGGVGIEKICYFLADEIYSLR
jgi:hypothetical protein